jgi:hypothetical protein
LRCRLRRLQIQWRFPPTPGPSQSPLPQILLRFRLLLPLLQTKAWRYPRAK